MLEYRYQKSKYMMNEAINITHITHYSYDRPVTLGPQWIRLKPNGYDSNELKSYTLNINPDPDSVDWFTDVHGNQIANVTFKEPTNELHIHVDICMLLNEKNLNTKNIDISCQKYPFFYSYNERKRIHPYLGAPEPTPLFESYCDELRMYDVDTLRLIDNVNKAVFNDIDYIKRYEPGIYSPEEMLTYKKGCCRDMAWLLVSIFRKLGIAARFVSGYSIRENKSISDSSEEIDLHAWCEVYITGIGWLGLDATCGLFCNSMHIPLAAAAYPFATAPVEGVLSECESNFWVEMNFTRYSILNLNQRIKG